MAQHFAQAPAGRRVPHQGAQGRCDAGDAARHSPRDARGRGQVDEDVAHRLAYLVVAGVRGEGLEEDVGAPALEEDGLEGLDSKDKGADCGAEEGGDVFIKVMGAKENGKGADGLGGCYVGKSLWGL